MTTASSPRHFIDLADVSAGELRTMLETGRAMKARRRDPADKPLAGKMIAMVFEQPSLAHAAVVRRRHPGTRRREPDGLRAEIELGERESIADTARVMSRYVDAIMVRMLDHAMLRELAEHATVPVINGLTKRSHPCQVMADIMTLEERQGDIAGKTVAWTGDSNNVLTSWMQAATRFPFAFRVATPPELAPAPALVDWARGHGADIRLSSDPYEAVEGADCVITDCWVSMGDKDEGRRHNLLQPYQVNERLLKAADRNAIVMHCLPATRGEELTDEVMDGPQSAVFDEAENRLHAQKGILAWCFGADSA